MTNDELEGRLKILGFRSIGEGKFFKDYPPMSFCTVKAVDGRVFSEDGKKEPVLFSFCSIGIYDSTDFFAESFKGCKKRFERDMETLLSGKRMIGKEDLMGLDDPSLNAIYANADGKYCEQTSQTAGDIQDERAKASGLLLG